MRARIVEDVYAEWFEHLAGTPGLEIHCDPDVCWKVSPAAAWSNCGVRLRLTESDARKRLDRILACYHQNGRGAGFWVGPAARPANLEEILTWKALRCRKYFPAMYCDLRGELPRLEAQVPLEIGAVGDYDIFRRLPHPSLGRISTAIRRFSLEAQRHLSTRSPRRAWELMASLDGAPAGICTLFLGRTHAGLFDLGVLEPLRNRGIGRALVSHACAFAQQRGAEGMILIATNAGYRVYEHAGFREVARMGFWYTAHP